MEMNGGFLVTKIKPVSYTHLEVISIHPDRKTVSVKNLENGEIFEENYDKMILYCLL